MTKSQSMPTSPSADPIRRKKAWNLAGFQLGWIACVLGAIEYAEPRWIVLLLPALEWGIACPAPLRIAHREARPC
jgi:hypothetical protein